MVYEGELLDPGDTVADTELAQEVDQEYVIVEVHIK